MKDKSITEDQILLGGKVSHLHEEFKEMAQLSPDEAKTIFCLKNYEKWLTMDPIEASIEILTYFGKVDNLLSWGEITKLSMIIGDPRIRRSAKKARDVLRVLQHAKR